MALREEFERQGNRLFRWRSYIPLIIIPLMIAAMFSPERFFFLGYYLKTVYYDIACIVISFFGLVIRCIAIGFAPKGTSGRNTKEQIAEDLNTTGIYSLVRHPLYLGNFIIFLGIILFVKVWWFVIIAILAFWLYYERIMYAEEEFLRNKFGNLYLQWAEKTPAFLPRIRGWERPNLPFSYKNVLKREYTGFYVIVISFTLLKISENILSEDPIIISSGWLFFLLIGSLIYLILRTLKKKTKLLHVEGR